MSDWKERLGVVFSTNPDFNYTTDAVAEDYNSEWTSMWLKKDGEILDKIGVSNKNLELMYHDNLLRFLGKTDTKVNHISPVIDAVHEWKPFD